MHGTRRGRCRGRNRAVGRAADAEGKRRYGEYSRHDQSADDGQSARDFTPQFGAPYLPMPLRYATICPWAITMP
jgi:hypothetical protein